MKLLLIAVASGSAHALSPAQTAQTSRRAPLTVTATGAAPAHTSRRALLATTATGAAALVLSPAAASAGSKLEDGLALPDGARQFNDFQGLKGEWSRFGERLKKTDLEIRSGRACPCCCDVCMMRATTCYTWPRVSEQRSYFQTYLPRTTSTTGNRVRGRDTPTT